MIILIIFILFLILFMLPFLPGIVEIIKKEDAAPLYIAMDYKRSPRYFANSFKSILSKATNGFTLDCGTHNVMLSKNEDLEIARSIKFPDYAEVNTLYYIDGDLISGRGVKFEKDIYVNKDAFIGQDNFIRALAADGSIEVSTGVRFLRWLDSDGDIHVGRGCNLGISTTSGGKLHLSEDCTFRRLFGRPVYTGNLPENFQAAFQELSRNVISLPSQMVFSRKNERFLPIDTIENNNIVFTKDIRIGKGCIFRGSIRSYGKLILEENVTVDGNIFSDGDIIIGKNARIRGHVFSQTSIYISEQTVISRLDTVKSVIAKKAVNIEKDVIIYGFISTEGTGKTE